MLFQYIAAAVLALRLLCIALVISFLVTQTRTLTSLEACLMLGTLNPGNLELQNPVMYVELWNLGTLEICNLAILETCGIMEPCKTLEPCL